MKTLTKIQKVIVNVILILCTIVGWEVFKIIAYHVTEHLSIIWK